MSSSSENTKMVQIPTGEDFSKMLECPICFEVALPPVYQCTTGHIVCSTCRPNLEKCGMCKAPYGGTRNFFYEALFEASWLPCKYAAAGEGCGEVMWGTGLKAHQEACDFRPLDGCLVVGCMHNYMNGDAHCTTPYSEYLEHMKEDHEVNTFSNGIGSMKYDSGDVPTDEYFRWPACLVELDEHSFFITCDTFDERVWVWARYFGPEGNVKKFRAKLTLGDITTECIQIWEGPVHSIRKRPLQVVPEGKCLITTMEALTPYLKEGLNGPYWELNFEIKKVEDDPLICPRAATHRFMAQVQNEALKKHWEA